MDDPNAPQWITAVASVFAAVGTVSAVVVALRQASRLSQRVVKVQCRLAVTADERVVVLRAINEGPKAVELTMAYVQTDDGQKVVSPFVKGLGDSLIGGKLLLEGQSAEVMWPQSSLAQARENIGFRGYWYAFFTDTLGNVYSDTFPGTKRTHKWHWGLRARPVRRVVTYELPAPEDDPLQ